MSSVKNILNPVSSHINCSLMIHLIMLKIMITIRNKYCLVVKNAHYGSYNARKLPHLP